jgi:hypothetical protein
LLAESSALDGLGICYALQEDNSVSKGRRTLDFALTCLDDILLSRINGNPHIVYLEPDTIVQVRAALAHL